jgi:hypothetical protein
MDNKASAIEIAPVEIWAEIFSHLLFDPIAFRTNPFFPGCKYHSALEEWQNPSRLLRIARQHASLRLVSRAWKSLADAYPHQIFHLKMNSVDVHQAQIRSATRLQVEWCKCPKECDCAEIYATSKKLLGEVCNTLMGSDSMTRILIIPEKAWARTMEPSSSETPSRVIAGVKALEVSGDLHFNPPIFSMYPNLIYLRLDLGSNDLHSVSATFPALTTLILSAESCPSVENFNWIIPNLQHAELTDNNAEREIPLLQRFLGKAWPKLISLKANTTWIDQCLPSEFWSHLPNLGYLGVSWLKEDDNLVPPPDGHPCEMVGNIENTYVGDARSILFKFARGWKGLKVISDMHCWDELDQPISDDCLVRQSTKFHGYCDAATCCRCIENAAYYCTEQGIRYEDHMGMSLDEHLALGLFAVGGISVLAIS